MEQSLIEWLAPRFPHGYQAMHETRQLPRMIQQGPVLYEDPYSRMVRVIAEFDGFTKEYFVSDRIDRAAVLVVEEGRVLLSRQYRLIVNRIALEIPGGGIEAGESPEETAVRECLEETGFRPVQPRPLLCYHPSLDIIRNFTHIFVSEASQLEGSVPDDACTWLPLTHCLDMIFRGQLVDVLTIVAVLAYQARATRK